MKITKLLSVVLLSCAVLLAMGKKPAAEPPPAAVLLETRWMLTDVAGKTVTANAASAADRVAHLILRGTDQMVNGSGGVNRLISKYTLGENNALAFAPAGATLMAGLPDAMDTERKFFQALAKTKKYKITGTNLILLDGGDGPLAVFTADTPQ